MISFPLSRIWIKSNKGFHGPRWVLSHYCIVCNRNRLRIWNKRVLSYIEAACTRHSPSSVDVTKVLLLSIVFQLIIIEIISYVSAHHNSKFVQNLLSGECLETFSLFAPLKTTKQTNLWKSHCYSREARSAHSSSRQVSLLSLSELSFVQMPHSVFWYAENIRIASLDHIKGSFWESS